MNDQRERIAQFENMAAADPTNEMAHFSLGNAYFQAGMPTEAATSFEKCITLNPEMSKAYERCGEAMIQAGWEDRAVQILESGFRVAATRGDRMPQDAIGQLLDGLGRPHPDVSDIASTQTASESDSDAEAGTTEGKPLDGPPFRGPLGEWIGQNITAENWEMWINQGTKVINELRLDLSRPEDATMYDQHMCEFLDVPTELRPS
ncbi:MAG: Fe(2+)-trafficking protein [Phycisphaerales bacterium]|nr:Fe(2+)-trafficking protein [Phycisphaerales bacterium]